MYLLSDRLGVIARDNDGGGGKDSEITVQLLPGTYTLVASMNAAGAGAYQLRVSTEPVRSCRPEVLGADTPVEADLADSDCRNLDLVPFLADALPVDVYRMEFSKPVVLTISMDSSAFDAFLSIHECSGARITTNNNGGGGTDAKLLVSLDPGTYTIRASAAKAGKGMYRLSAKVEDRRSCLPATLPLNEPVRGELTTGDCRYLDVVTGSTIPFPVDQYRFELKDRALVTLSLKSNVLDTIVLLLDSRGLLIDINDDIDRTTSDSRLILSLSPGVYTVLATDYYGESGSYEISVATASLRTCTPARLSAPGTAASAVQTDGCRVMDVISPSSDSSPAAVVELTVKSRSLVNLAATGTGFEPAIQVRNATATTQLAIGEKANELTSLMHPGTYTVLATSRDGGRGEFSLTSTTSEPAPCVAEPLSVGVAAIGELVEADCAFKDIVAFTTLSFRTDLWKVTLDSARSLSIEISADTFAPIVFLLDENFVPLNLTLNPAGSSTLRLPWTARAGTYHLVVSSTERVLGKYQLRLAPVSTGAQQ